MGTNVHVHIRADLPHKIAIHPHSSFLLVLSSVLSILQAGHPQVTVVRQYQQCMSKVLEYGIDCQDSSTTIQIDTTKNITITSLIVTPVPQPYLTYLLPSFYQLYK